MKISQANKKEDDVVVVDDCRRLLDQQASMPSQSQCKRGTRSRPLCVSTSRSSSSSRLLLRASVLSVLLLLSRPAQAQFFSQPTPDLNGITAPPIPSAPPIPGLSRPTRQPTQRPTRRPTPRPTLEDRQDTSASVEPAVGIPIIEPTFAPTIEPTPAPIPNPTPSPTHAPTHRPTRRPTVVPTPNPTPEPTSTPLPTKEPTTTPEPTFRFTPQPSLRPVTQGPTDRPTRSPTPTPTNEPVVTATNPPTRFPTRAPTLRPTNLPTLQPTPGPTRSPTTAPTAIFSRGPSIAPTPVTPKPTISAEPSPQPSHSPSKFPSPQPSHSPSSTPSVPPTKGPTAEPTSAPSLSLQSDLVNVVMVLTATRGDLVSGAAIKWESATAAHIRQSISNTDFKDQPLFDLLVNTNIIRQLPLTNGIDSGSVPAPNASTVTSDPTSAPVSVRGRALQVQEPLLPLQIVFDVAVSFRSLGQDYDAVAMVGDAFNSDEDRAAYTLRLRQTLNAAFTDVTQVELLVEGVAPQEDIPKGNGSSGSNVWVVVGAAAGGSLVMIVAGFFAMRRFGAGGSKSNGQGANTASMTEVRMGVSTEIAVDRQDDISTLGDPGMYGGGGMVMGSSLPRDERTASLGDDYDYAKYLAATPGGAGQSVAESRSRLTSTDSGRGSSKVLGGPMANTVFSDDESFEQQYSTAEDKFEVTVPAGKLGMVIDTPNGGVPVVHAIKTESILSTSVQVGDKLVSVDREDVTAMTAVQVSKLISLKSDQKRVLAFIRIRAPDGSLAK